MNKILNSIKNIGLSSILTIVTLLICVILGLLIVKTTRQQYAFPSAQGYGAFTSGGRGGVVYHVRTLKDTNELGSLRYAVNQKGARTILFDVSGNIQLNSPLEIKHGNLTIAGQTAPGNGIYITNHPVIINADNVILRYIRIRLGNEGSALIVKNRNDIMIDHCSFSWAKDSNVEIYNNRNLTMQWCIISEALYNGLNSGYGAKLGGFNATYHHNLFASNKTHNPYFIPSSKKTLFGIETIDFRNNILFNWGNSTINGTTGSYNIVNNYYRPGPATNIPSRSQIISMENSKGKDIAFVTGNYIESYPLQSNDNWMAVQPNVEYIKTSKNDLLTRFEFAHDPVTTQMPSTAFKNIIKYAGASINRDQADKRIALFAESYISTTKTGNGIISNINDAGGFEKYQIKPPIIDSDGDGMSDEWELANNFNPYDAGDGKLVAENGYTNLENYLNSLTKEITEKQNKMSIPNIDMLKLFIQKVVNLIKKD